MKTILVFSVLLVSQSQIVDAQRGPNKIVLINIRGASKTFVDKALNEGVLDKKGGFFLLDKKAQIRTSLDPVINAVTAVNNASLETGAYPETHGIVGNSFGLLLNGKVESVSGFGTALQSETIWEKAVRLGKRVIRLGTLQVNGFGKNEYQVPTLPQVAPMTESQVADLVPADCSYRFSTQSSKFRCFSGRKPITFGSIKKELNFVTVGDSLIIDDDSLESNGVLAKVKQGEWFALELAKQDTATVALHAKLLKLNAVAQIYFGPPFRNNGFPKSFTEKIEKNVGFTVGGPDYAGYLQGKIGLEILLEQAHRETEFMQKVALFCLKNVEFDLLLYDHPILDRYGHYTSGTDFSRLKNGYLATDRNLLDVLKAIDKNTSLAVVSGHGFSSAHSSISSHRLLEEIGEDADISIFASKVSAHIYLNNRNMSEPVEHDYLRRLKQKLLNYREKKAGAKIIERVFVSTQMKHNRLLNRQHSGDLWICLKAGYTFDGVISSGELMGKPTFAGEHGYFDKNPKAKGLFYYYSPRKITLAPKIRDTTGIWDIIWSDKTPR